MPLKYEIFAGYAYTSLNQVNLSRFGLQGGKLGVMRNWGKYFGLPGTVDYYRLGVSTSGGANPAIRRCIRLWLLLSFMATT